MKMNENREDNYLLFSQKLFEFELEKFNRLYATFIRLTASSEDLQNFRFDRVDKPNMVIIHITPRNKENEKFLLQDTLIDNPLIHRLITIASNYFLLSPKIFSHTEIKSSVRHI